jgi:maleylpyruvate isomerase
MRLYSYFRSSAAYRVRIALALKKLDAEILPVHLLRGGGEQLGPIYRKLNPQALVPTLETEAGALTQSLAIIEYLEETHPQPPLLPRDPYERARVRAFALVIACDIHPLNNLRVLNKLRADLSADQAAIEAWYCHWITLGLGALETIAPARKACASATGRGWPISAWCPRWPMPGAMPATCRQCRS